MTDPGASWIRARPSATTSASYGESSRRRAAWTPLMSTASLLFAPKALGIAKHDLHLEVAVHLGTLGSVVVYYRALLLEMAREFFRGGPARRLFVLVVVGTLPAVAIALGLKHALDLREN